MSRTTNEELTRKLLSSFQAGDLAAAGSCFAADAVWDFPGRSAVHGVYKGPDEIVGFLAKAFELSGGSLAIELVDVTASDNGATQVQWVSGEHGGRSMRAVELIHHEISDGEIQRTYHRSDEGAITSFFGQA
jgi:uncharacterized protein